ncbi:MAG TPA: prepilin-type N-terminal cleavage/methylation domain-containing protein [Candidatus Woesebacteria bacterium]|mgnify:CR=1 FL=1|nr:prepilin-type N-terminal cleavage/methylation domain-containing protein [Candidatus Woesebacteria bacterium]
MRKGFTLIELLLVLAIISILFAISIVNLNNLQQNTYQNTSGEIFISDLKLQQLKSMTGDNNSSSSFQPFGIHFETNSYTLFRGANYSSSNPENFTVELNPNLSFSTVKFANSQIIFAKNSGEIVGFTEGNNTIIIRNSITNTDSTITLNRYGVITHLD